MSHKKVQELAKKYAERLMSAEERNKEFHIQRTKMWHFYMFFYRRLRAILGDMEGDIRSLKEKGFDHKMLKMFIKARQDLIELLKSVDKERPYIMAEKFVNYVLNRPNSIVLENLDFLIQHHLEMNRIDTPTGALLGQVSSNSIGALQELAKQVKEFMAHNPSIPIPGGSQPPTSMELPQGSPIPHMPALPEQLTNLEIPLAKKKELG